MGVIGTIVAAALAWAISRRLEPVDDDAQR
jgi:hypothetical protein